LTALRAIEGQEYARRGQNVLDAIEGMGKTTFAHGVMNWTKDDHWGYQPETGVMLKVVNGEFVLAN